MTKAINDLPVAEIDTALVLKVLEPIWQRKDRDGDADSKPKSSWS